MRLLCIMCTVYLLLKWLILGLLDFDMLADCDCLLDGWVVMVTCDYFVWDD